VVGEDLTKEELTRLLREAEAAHGRYEKEELGGERDADWASWYAGFIVNALREVGGERTSPARRYSGTWSSTSAPDANGRFSRKVRLVFA
jgi:hypothetical protein